MNTVGMEEDMSDEYIDGTFVFKKDAQQMFFFELKMLLSRFDVDIQSISSTGSSILINSKHWKSIQIDGTSDDANLNADICKKYETI